MRKGLFVALIILCLASFAGCSKDKPGPQNPEGTPIAANDLVSEDYRQGNASAELDGYLMRTEQGYYY